MQWRTFQLVPQLAVSRLLLYDPQLHFLHTMTLQLEDIPEPIDRLTLQHSEQAIVSPHLLSIDKLTVLFLSRLVLGCAARQVCTDGSLAPFQHVQAALGLKARGVCHKCLSILPQQLARLCDVGLCTSAH